MYIYMRPSTLCFGHCNTNMSHRKIHSQGSIPFSWEDKPGVSRISPQECPKDRTQQALNLSSASASPNPQPPRQSTPDNNLSNSLNSSAHGIKIPLPPCPLKQSLIKSTSSKGLIGWWQQDPFLLAYKECTKSARNVKLSASTESKKSTSKPRKKSKFIFSCKNSCDVRDDNLVRLGSLPPLPKHRIRTCVVEQSD